MGELVLIVDDDEDLCAVLADLLDSHGLQTRCATSVAAAVAALDQPPPSLVVLDWLMPDGPPTEVLARCRRHNIPVVLSSASADTTQLAGELGAVASLPKPFDVESLFRVLDRFVARRGVPAHS